MGVFAVVAVFWWRTQEVHKEFSKVILSEDGDVLDLFLTSDEKWRVATRLSKAGKAFQNAVLCLEDKRFYSHGGVDPIALARAIKQNVAAGSVVSGASTITMQLARMTRPKSRNVLSKIIEATDAVGLELLFTKDQILKLYLSLAPYGHNVEGVAAASIMYFNKPIADLSLHELATLLLIPQSPVRVQKLSFEGWLRARNRNLKRMLQCGIMSEDEFQTQISQKMRVPRYKGRSAARHISVDLRGYSKDKLFIQTTIDKLRQIQVEELLLRQKDRLKNLGIKNAAVLVVDHKTHEVKVAVGNFPHNSKDRSSAINALNVPRSPGSTLKPLIYALAIEEGYLLPDTLLQDVPIRISKYKPQNFDGKFNGLIKAKDALTSSLNIPFVVLLRKLGIDRFVSEMETVGAKVQNPLHDIGLSMAIGGVEMTPWSLVKMYAAFANRGISQDLVLEKQDLRRSHLQWRDQGAVALLSTTLAEKKRPNAPAHEYFRNAPPDIKWKTGTSQGRRDAWSIGYNDAVTVLVWLGNLDMQSATELIGTSAAGPIMFDIFDMFGQKSTYHSYQDEIANNIQSLEPIEVCAYSGYLPHEGCTKRPAWEVGSRPFGRVCPYHQVYEVDTLSGHRVLPGCRESFETAQRVGLFFPPKVSQWLSVELNAVNRKPKLHPKCQMQQEGYETLTFKMPKQNHIYYLGFSGDKNATIHLPVDLEYDPGSGPLQCLLNGSPIPAPRKWTDWVLELGEGVHHLYCSDRYAASGYVSFQVRKL